MRLSFAAAAFLPCAMAATVMKFINPPAGGHQTDFSNSPVYQLGSVVNISWTPTDNPETPTSLTLWQIDETTKDWIEDQEYINRKGVDITTFRWIVATTKNVSASKVFYLSLFREGQPRSDSDSHTFFIVEPDNKSPPPSTSSSANAGSSSPRVSPPSRASSSSRVASSSSGPSPTSGSSPSSGSPPSSGPFPSSGHSPSLVSPSSGLVSAQSGSAPSSRPPSTGTNLHTTTPPTSRNTNTSSKPESTDTTTDPTVPPGGPSNTPTSNNGLDTAAIIGIIIGITLVVILGAISGYLFFRRRNMRGQGRLGKKYNGMVEDQSTGPFEKWAGTPRSMGDGMIYQISPSELPVPPTELPTGLEKPRVYELP
ncbi:hypothetical protein B0J18DRAFT_427500 [Chaetomium sp. MPI-SDFR-AT-0129]|nr:hypothetical protein B0J18DRAFT_427500 [Chaetomium sp. MPI-SDFR-AT-0129]